MHALRRASALLRLALALLPAAGLPAAAVEPDAPAPAIEAGVWLNSEPLGPEDLRGKVVLVEFWTFACHNCQAVEPYVKRWHAEYADRGLVVIAVHTPELSFERDVENVRRYVREHGLRHPIAVDGSFSTWRAFGNRAWPTLYLVGREGRIRYRRIGEGGYEATEARIRALLEETPG